MSSVDIDTNSEEIEQFTIINNSENDDNLCLKLNQEIIELKNVIQQIKNDKVKSDEKILLNRNKSEKYKGLPLYTVLYIYIYLYLLILF